MAKPDPADPVDKLCPNPEECCKALTRVWRALGIDSYAGKYVWEHVAELRSALAAADAHAQARERDWEQELAAMGALVRTLQAERDTLRAALKAASGYVVDRIARGTPRVKTPKKG